MRTAFVGAVKGSLCALEGLIAAGRPPALVITLDPEAKSRHCDYANLVPRAKACGAEVLLTRDINSEEVIEALDRQSIDLSLLMGWSQICRREFREATPLGALGFHPGPLPKYRGRAVIPWTILAELEATASTFFFLDDGIDSGPILLQRFFPIEFDETATSLYRKHSTLMSELLPEAVRMIESGDYEARHQDERFASYCAKRDADDGLIDWKEPAEQISKLVRAVAEPYPGAFTYLGDSRIVIKAVRNTDDPYRYIGLPGQVQARTPSSFTVRCGDGKCLDVVSWFGCGQGPPRLHEKLGRATARA